MPVVARKIHMTERLSKRVSNAMRLRNLTACRLAKKIKVDTGVINRWLGGRDGVTEAVCADVCRVLELT